MTYTNFDDDELNEICNRSKDFFKDKSSKWPVVSTIWYRYDAVYKFRIWPEKYSKDGKNYRRVLREVKGQKLDTRSFGETPSDDFSRVDFWRWYRPNEQALKLIDSAIEAGVDEDELRKYRVQDFGCFMARIIECPRVTKASSRVLRPNIDACIVLPRRGVYAFHEFVASLSKSQKRIVLDPLTPAPPVVLRVEDKQYRFLLDEKSDPYELDSMNIPFGATWRGLDSVFITEQDIVPENVFFEFRSKLSRMIAEANGSDDLVADHPARFSSPFSPVKTSFDDPLATSLFARKPSLVFAKESEDSTVPVDTLPEPVFDDPLNPERKCDLRNDFSQEPEFAEQWNAYGFGAKPDQPLMQCSMCKVREECENLTSAKRNELAA